MIRKQNRRKWIGGLTLMLAAVVFLLPLGLVILNSFKTLQEYDVSIVALPKAPSLDNYRNVLEKIDYARVYFNSIVIEILSMVGIILISSMAASKVARRRSRINSAVYYLLLLSMIIPFQARMLPLMSVVGTLHMSNSLWGMSLLHIATLSPPVFFLYVGAMKTVPLEIEEAARIDGAEPFQLYFRVVLPLLKPMTMTVTVLYGLVVWNSFLMPMLVLTQETMRTVPLVVYKFFGAYKVDWVSVFAAIILGALPIYCVFLALQKYVVKGVTAGGVKG